MGFVGVGGCIVHKRTGSRGTRRRSVVVARRREWMEVEVPDAFEDDQDASLRTSKGPLQRVRGERIVPQRRDREAKDEDLFDGASIMSTIIIVSSGLALGLGGLGPPLAKKLLVSSVMLTSLTGLGAFWVSRSLIGAKLPVLNKSIQFSDTNSTAGTYFRNMLVRKLSESRDTDEKSSSESYFPFINEDDVHPGQREATRQALRATDPTADFSEWA